MMPARMPVSGQERDLIKRARMTEFGGLGGGLGWQTDNFAPYWLMGANDPSHSFTVKSAS